MHVHFQGSHSAGEQYLQCVDWSVNLTVSFILQGDNSALGCHGDRALRSYLRFYAARPGIIVTLADLDVHQASITIKDAGLELRRGVFRDVVLQVVAVTSPIPAIVVHNVTWLGRADCSDDYKCVPTGALQFKGYLSELHIQSSTLLHTKLGIMATTDVNVTLRHNLFGNVADEHAVQAGVFVALSTSGQNSTVTVDGCVFENQFHWNPVDSVSNIFMSALLVRLLPPPGFPISDNNVRVTVSNSTFRNNERALTFQGLLEHILIADCVFHGNVAMHAGAGILLLVFTMSPVHVSNCTFHGNAAGFFRHTNVRPPGSYFR